MNWMTSGRHRALYSQRGRRRQMHFPSQVQHQRVKSTSTTPCSQPVKARDPATPWYIVPVGGGDESQDIRVLELERKGAMTAAEIKAEEKAGKLPRLNEQGNEDKPRSSPRQNRSRGQDEQEARDGRSENRCIFTPVKKTKRRYQTPDSAQLPKRVREDRPPSSIASGVDMIFFNDGEQLPHKNRAQRTGRVTTEPIPQDAHNSRYSQQTSGEGGQGELQTRQNNRDEDLHSYNQEFKAQQQSTDSGNAIFYGHKADNEADLRDFQLWRVNASSCAGLNPDLTCVRPASAAFRNAEDPPSDVSPLSFRMSRAEVLQSQLSIKAHDPLDPQATFTPSPCPSTSPSISTSSQCSIIVDRPPLGWHKKLQLALEEDTTDNPNTRFGRPASLPENSPPSNVVTNKLESAPLETSAQPSSYGESDSDNSIISAAIPIDAKERIMAAAASHHLSENSRNWYHQPTTTKPSDMNAPSAVFSGKSIAIQHSWVMSSRTKTILDAISASKIPSMENSIGKHDTKCQEMESVAIYMYTLVQCYKIDERFRAASAPSVVPSAPTTTTLASQIAGRREIIFSPKRAS